MRISLRRIGVALGALVEAVLVIWLLGGFLPAGLQAVVLSGLTYRDIMRRRPPDWASEAELRPFGSGPSRQYGAARAGHGRPSKAKSVASPAPRLWTAKVGHPQRLR
jgi:hypothetical protein